MATAHRGLVHLRRGLRLARDGEVAAARQALAMAIDDHDTTVAMHDRVAGPFNNRAVCRCVAAELAARVGDSAAAVKARRAAADDLDRALLLDATLPEVHHNRGLIALRTGDVLHALGRRAAAVPSFEAAVAAFTDALARMPDAWQHEAVCRRLCTEAQGRLESLVR
jgi:hypothetical protein